MSDYTIILFYKYISIDDPTSLRAEIKLLCQKLDLKGRVIVANEGINATLEGTSENIEKFINQFSKDKRFQDVQFKKSRGTGKAFPKLSVKVRNELVAFRFEKDIKPWNVTGEYITAEELHDWFISGKKFYIVDMRNDFEQEVGHFENSFLTGMEHSEDLPGVLKEIKKLPNDGPIVTVCTGGIRCEKASGFLVDNGISDVYQLYGGIHTYIEKYPGEHFLGSLYTFDSRLIMAFNMDDLERKIIGKCVICKNPSENFINCKDDYCHRHFICCAKCLDGKETIFCPMGCRDYSKEHPELLGA